MGYHIPGEEHDGAPLWRASFEAGAPHTLWVNREGKRFCDESFYKDFNITRNIIKTIVPNEVVDNSDPEEFLALVTDYWKKLR